MDIPLDNPILSSALGLFFAIAVALALLLSRARSDIGMLERSARENSRVLQELHRLRTEQQATSQFFREFAILSTSLQECFSFRRIPEILLMRMVRIFEARDAVVLIRRRSTTSEPKRNRQFIVAAAANPSTRKKQEIVILGQGELGFVAQAGLTMDRADLASARVAHDPNSPLAGFRADFAAAMVADGETLGVIAVSTPGRLQDFGKSILGLVAHAGAAKLKSSLALHQIRAVTDADPLTGIFNKRVLASRLGELLYQAADREEPLSIFLFDIDQFKNYNDLNGHVAGDALLVRLVRLIEEEIRTDDVFGRFGGEEFLLILPGRSATEAHIVAEKLRALVAAHEFLHRERQPTGQVSISGGVAAFPRHAESSTRLLRLADEALYQAKESGRNRVCVADDDTYAHIEDEPQTDIPSSIEEPSEQSEGVDASDVAYEHQNSNGSDDLTQIRGIGLGFDRLLRQAGIVRYHQIARFHQFGLQSVATLLKVPPGRIERDRWVEQARVLHERKYGSGV